MRLIDEIAYQYKIAKIPMEERTFVKAWETAQDMPTIDAVPVVRGEWIDSPTGNYAICSYCHVEWSVFDNDTYRFRHCPACGAKMEDKP